MPAALPADWPGIRLLYAQGETLESLAASTGISLNTLKARSAREGWNQKAVAVAEQKQTAKVAVAVQSGQMQPRATNGSDIVQATLEQRKKATKLSLSKWAVRGSKHLASLKGESAVAAHQAAVGVATVFGKLYPEQAGDDRVSLQFFAITMQQPEEQGPVIDVTPGDSQD